MKEYLINELEQLVLGGYEKFYLYPASEMGLLAKEILDGRLGKEAVLVDNQLSKLNSKILNVESLQNTDENEKAVLLIVSLNYEIYMSLRLEVKKYRLNMPVKELVPNNADARIASLALCAKEIYRNNVQGSVAEAGVYKGDFAKCINALFPDRKLYLFDSFEGFDREMVVSQHDNVEQTNLWIESLKDTSVNLVMQKMKHKDKVIIKKGFFPQTAYEGEVDKKFAFVNLDMDIYQPTYEGLHFFWNRLSKGGYIFVHDFGHWDGIEDAVLRFCHEQKIGYAPIADNRSIVISKPLG